ncbi:MAG: hypothetical protein WBD40_01560 [Tepidisphaeraceae bacterium]
MFVFVFPVLCIAAVVILFSEGMRAFAPPSATSTSTLEQTVGWLVMTPLRPSEEFPTGNMLLNLIVAVGVNAAVWSWVGSFVVATAACFFVRLIRSPAKLRKPT